MWIWVGVFCSIWAAGASMVFEGKLSPGFMIGNVIANLIFLAPFIISWIRVNGYHWPCLVLPLLGSFLGGVIDGVAKGSDSSSTLVLGVFSWLIAMILALVMTPGGKDK